MSKTDSKQPGFSIQFENDRTYTTLHIKIISDVGERAWDVRSAWVKFQATNANGAHNYYGGRLDVGDLETMEELDGMHKLLKRIFKQAPDAGPFRINGNPCPVLKALIDSKLPQVVYDCRVSQYVKAADVAAPEFKPWRDDYNKYEAGGSCHVACMAANEDEARRLLTIAFAESSCPSYARAKYLEPWLAAGRPVLALNRDQAPEVHHVRGVLDQISAALEAAALVEKERWAKQAEEIAAAPIAA